MPVTDIAQELGAPQMANMIMLGAYRDVTGIMSEDILLDYLGKDAKEERFAAVKEAYMKGVTYAKENFK